MLADQFGHLLFLMAAGHALCDFTLQDSFTSRAKYASYNKNSALGVHWFVALMCHSLVHGGAVALVTGSWLLGVAETLCHATIDFGKSRGYFNAYVDQCLHGACKLAWALLILHTY